MKSQNAREHFTQGGFPAVWSPTKVLTVLLCCLMGITPKLWSQDCGTSNTPLTNHSLWGNSALTGNLRTHVIVIDPHNQVPAPYTNSVEQYLIDVDSTRYLGIINQYGGSSKTTFIGPTYVSTAAQGLAMIDEPTQTCSRFGCATNPNNSRNIQYRIEQALAARPQWEVGSQDLYFVLLPPGASLQTDVPPAVCMNMSCGFPYVGACGYHEQYFSLSRRNNVVYAVIGNDGCSAPTQIVAHEQMEMITDPNVEDLFGGWWSSNFFQHCEVADVCQPDGSHSVLLGGDNQLQLPSVWSNKDNRCVALSQPTPTPTPSPAPSPTPTPAPNSCPNGDGLYCGSNGVPGDPKTLYQCSNGNLTAVQVCANGCTPMPPGVKDQCAGSANSCPNGNGLYCGHDGISGDPNTLYQCTNGSISVAQVCSNGCTPMPVGTPDQCASSSTPVCPNGDGLYCGGNGIPGNPRTLYQCTGGNLTVAEQCVNGCTPMPPGVKDECAGSGTTSCPNGNGLYCGRNGISGDPNTLYQCTNGTISLVQVCSNGCTPMPVGTPDQCAANPVAVCPNGNGLYCGGNGVPGDPKTLYQCTNGTVSVAQVCSIGCTPMPKGISDQCASAAGSCPNGNGLYCGGNGVSGDPNTLYECTNGNISVAQACSNGCTHMPVGVPDQCTAPSGSCPNGNGLYCGGDGVSGDPNTLYECTNGTLSVLQTCFAGCVPMPPGTPDACAAPAGCPNGNGFYCGGNGVNGDTNTLYQCTNGVLSSPTICATGCSRQPTGVADKCASTACPAGNGLYCGGDGVGGSTNTLYQCTNGVLTVSKICATGCAKEPAGIADKCASATCPAGNGLYCGGANGVGGDPSTLYQCTNGVLSVSEICATGCVTEPAGVADKCASTTCPAGNGLYCGGASGVKGIASTLYQCTSGALSPSRLCANACQVMAPGVPDECR